MQAMSVSTVDDLLVGCNHLLNHRSMCSSRYFMLACQATEIVHAFEYDEPSGTCGGKHIAIEARQCIRAESVDKQVISADALVRYGNVASGRRVLQPAGKYIGPAVVSIRGGAMPIGDGVAQCDDGSS